jgi:hypothetical protein
LTDTDIRAAWSRWFGSSSADSGPVPPLTAVEASMAISTQRSRSGSRSRSLANRRSSCRSPSRGGSSQRSIRSVTAW